MNKPEHKKWGGVEVRRCGRMQAAASWRVVQATVITVDA